MHKILKCSIIIVLCLFNSFIHCDGVKNKQQPALISSSAASTTADSTFTATYFLDFQFNDGTNLTCKDESRPCRTTGQIIDAALLELANVTNLDSFNMIIRANQFTGCGERSFDFSKQARKFNLFVIGNPTFDTCEELVKEKSIINQLVMERFTMQSGIVINTFQNIDTLIMDSMFDQQNQRIRISNVKHLQISNTDVSNAQLSNVEHLSIVNAKMETTNFGSPKIMEITNSNIIGDFYMSNFQLFSIRNSYWNGYFSEFISGDNVNIYNSTINSPSLFISISNITFEKINISDGYFTDYMFQIVRGARVSIIESTFYNNSLALKPLFSLQLVTKLNIERCDFSSNNGGFLIVANDHNRYFKTSYYLSHSKFYNNQLYGSSIFEMHGSVYGYDLYANSLDFVNNSNGISSCFTISGGFIVFNNSKFISNSATKGSVIYLTDTCFLQLINSVFTNNIADLGGVFYISQTSNLEIRADNVKCESNFASNAGGCIYSELPLTRWSNQPIQFINNTALSYGNDIAYPLEEIFIKDLSGNLLDNTQIYSGNSLNFNIFISNNVNQSASFSDKLSIAADARKATIYQNIKPGSGLITAIVQVIPLDRDLTFIDLTIYTSPLLRKDIRIEILPCPYSYSLQQSDDGFSCVYTPLDVIIPAVIFGVISVLIAMGAITYGMVFIIRKLMKLRKQEKAEKEIEEKFNNKEFIFGTEPTESSSLLSNSINSNERSQYIIPISDIEIIKKIGEGGMASVYYALWNRSAVAIKKLKTETDNDEFERESILMSSLRHPSIVSCYGVSITTTTKYLVVEYMENGSLESAIYASRQGREILKFKTKLNILIDIAKGMTYLHTIKPHKIIHRDLKSANVLLDKNMNAKVGDFGLSKVVSGNSTITTNIGTLFYCAPEILSNQNLKDHSTKLDVYSLSIVMWELLFEMQPYSDELDGFMNSFSILVKVTKGKRPTLLFGNSFETVTEEWILHNFTKKQLQTIGKLKIIQILTKYIELMQSCWSSDPSLRPEFIQITDLLHSLQQEL